MQLAQHFLQKIMLNSARNSMQTIIVNDQHNCCSSVKIKQWVTKLLVYFIIVSYSLTILTPLNLLLATGISGSLFWKYLFSGSSTMLPFVLTEKVVAQVAYLGRFVHVVETITYALASTSILVLHDGGECMIAYIICRHTIGLHSERQLI